MRSCESYEIRSLEDLARACKEPAKHKKLRKWHAEPRKTCHDCSHLGTKQERFFGCEIVGYYCKLGVKNRRDDPNRKDGKCVRFELKERREC